MPVLGTLDITVYLPVYMMVPTKPPTTMTKTTPMAMMRFLSDLFTEAVEDLFH